jgi:hypothetical protein
MLDQIAEQLRRPADAAFKERETQFREAPGDAAETAEIEGLRTTLTPAAVRSQSD